jgi:outer membrane protein assembly factor BamB
MEQGRAANERTIADLVYVGFNRRVVALDRYSGELIWSWKSPRGSGFVALLVDGDRLIVSAQGYTYCLDPHTGQEVWRNLLEGMGVGVPCLASINGSTGSSAASEVIDQERAAAAAAG